MSDMLIRPALRDDLEAINNIYNHYVTRSTCTYQEEPETIGGRLAWFERHGPEHPVTAAILDGRVVGWGALSPFHPRSAYRRTVENAVYVSPEHHRRGIGRALLTDLIERGQAAGHHSIIALIDGEQPQSVALHTACGFTRVAYLPQVGYKFGRWLDVIYMQRML